MVLAGIILRSSRWMRHEPPKRLLTFNGLQGVISQKIELFITIAVRTSNPTRVMNRTGRERRGRREKKMIRKKGKAMKS